MTAYRDRHPGAEAAEIQRSSPGSWVDSLLVVAGLAALWEIVSWWTPDYIVPGWSLIGSSLLKLITQHPDWVAQTCARVLLSLVLSFVIGCAGAVAMYRSRWLERLLNPLIRIIMAVPVICWILFAVLWFNGTEVRIAAVLMLVCAPIFLIDLLDAMRGVPKAWTEMVRSFRPTWVDLFTKLLLPAVWPATLTSWKVNLSLAIRVVTIAELVGATSGIGYGLTVAQSQLSLADIFAWTLILVALLLSFQRLLTWLESSTLRWRES